MSNLFRKGAGTSTLRVNAKGHSVVVDLTLLNNDTIKQCCIAGITRYVSNGRLEGRGLAGMKSVARKLEQNIYGSGGGMDAFTKAMYTYVAALELEIATTNKALQEVWDKLTSEKQEKYTSDFTSKWEAKHSKGLAKQESEQVSSTDN